MNRQRDILSGRFEFRQSGSFRKINKYHKFLKIIIAAICVVLSFGWCKLSFSLIETGDFFTLMLIIAGIIVIATLGIFASRIFNDGETWRYEADGLGITFTCGKKSKHFRYSEVIAVSYERVEHFGSFAGYNISIATTTNVDTTFSYKANSIDERGIFEGSPFYILKNPPIITDDTKENNEYYELLRR